MSIHRRVSAGGDPAHIQQVHRQTQKNPSPRIFPFLSSSIPDEPGHLEGLLLQHLGRDSARIRNGLWRGSDGGEVSNRDSQPAVQVSSNDNCVLYKKITTFNNVAMKSSQYNNQLNSCHAKSKADDALLFFPTVAPSAALPTTLRPGLRWTWALRTG